jgi:hypothetical protein
LTMNARVPNQLPKVADLKMSTRPASATCSRAAACRPSFSRDLRCRDR